MSNGKAQCSCRSIQFFQVHGEPIQYVSIWNPVKLIFNGAQMPVEADKPIAEMPANYARTIIRNWDRNRQQGQ